MISEKVELLGKGHYKNIPDVLTLKSIPTISELDMVGSDDFVATMLDKILPQAVEEEINFRELLEIDYDWVCRCLRFLNYGPYYTVNAIFCDKCNTTSRGEYVVDLRSIECKQLPPDFTDDITISRDSLMDYNGDIVISLPTIQDSLNAYNDPLFQTADGRRNNDLARICYTVKSMGGKSNMSPIEVRTEVEKKLSPADYALLKREVVKLTDYGLRIGGRCSCPKCHSENATFMAFTDDRFFRPTVGDLRKWRDDRDKRQA
jgi:hypothetical protein